MNSLPTPSSPLAHAVTIAAACLVGLLGWIAIAAVTALWQRHQGLLGHEHDRVTWDYYRPRVLMTCIMVAFFLYPQVGAPLAKPTAQRAPYLQSLVKYVLCVIPLSWHSPAIAPG
jgi:hypothetical protein